MPDIASHSTHGRQRIVAAVFLLLFVASALVSAQRKDVTQGFDEVAHLSYVAHLQESGALWPRIERMRLLDPASFRFGNEANYLNHPPFYYALLATLGPRVADNPGSAFTHRLFNIVLGALGFAALLAIVLAARLPPLQFYAYAVPLFCIPVLAPIAGAVNSDNAAFAGGALATLAAWQFHATRRPAWFGAMLTGFVIASWAKFTGFVLAGSLLGGLLLYLLWRRQLRAIWLVPAAMAALLAFAPYAVYFAQYGSPTLDTLGLMAMLHDGARSMGWADAPRLSFPAYVIHFLSEFVAGWMPALTQRSALNYAVLVFPVAAIACAIAGAAISARRLARREETTLDVVVLAGMLSIAVTLAAHIVFSYRHHLATGWMMEAYPRYYLPLIAIIPLAALSLLSAVKPPQWRALLLAVLIAGPILFRILGAPLTLATG